MDVGQKKRLSQTLYLCRETLHVQLTLVRTLRTYWFNMVVWASLYLLALKTGNYWVLPLHPLVIFLIDLSERFLGVSPFAREENSTICYNRVKYMTHNPYGGPRSTHGGAVGRVCECAHVGSGGVGGCGS